MIPDLAFLYIVCGLAFGCVAADEEEVKPEYRKNWAESPAMFVFCFLFIMTMWPVGVIALMLDYTEGKN